MPRDIGTGKGTGSDGDVPGQRCWWLRRRSTLTDRQLLWLGAALCLPTLTLAAAFLWWGYWHMLAYAALEALVMAACLHHHARHLDDYDRIELSDDCLVVEQRRGRCHCLWSMPPWCTQVLMPPTDLALPLLACGDLRVQLGRCAPATARRQVAAELTALLPQLPWMPAPAPSLAATTPAKRRSAVATLLPNCKNSVRPHCRAISWRSPPKQ